MVEGALRGMANGIGTMLIAGLISFILLVFLVIYFVYDKFIEDNTPKIESRTLLTPEIKLTTDGKTIDTLYVYKSQKK